MSFLDAPAHHAIGRLDYAVRDHGPRDGRPIILMHGFADTSASYAALVDAMETLAPERFRFIAPDWRGHGDSGHLGASYWFPDYLADLEALIDTLPELDGDLALVGHSMGGQIASFYAGLRPERIDRLITLDSLNVPDADSADAPRRYRRWLDAHRNPPSHRVQDDHDSVVDRIGRRYPELPLETRQGLARHWAEPVEGGWRWRFDPWHRAPFPYPFRLDDAMAIWREVRADVLCIDAGESPVLDFVEADDMARRRACFERLTHHTVAGAGHMLHLEAPAAIAKRIVSFV